MRQLGAGLASPVPTALVDASGRSGILLVIDARRAADGLAPLLFLRSTGRNDVTTYADGEMGLWSRVLARRLGAPLVFVGSVGRRQGSVGWPKSRTDDRGLRLARRCRGSTASAGSWGSRPRNPSLLAYTTRRTALWRIRDCFCRSGSNRSRSSGTKSSRAAALDQIGMSIQGLTVASPNKESAAELATIRSRAALRAASANLLFRRGAAGPQRRLIRSAYLPTSIGGRSRGDGPPSSGAEVLGGRLPWH